MKSAVAALSLGLTLVGASTAAASSITIKTEAGTTYTTGGINDFSAQSSQMNGMTITANWTVNGTAHTQTAVWNSGVAFSGSSFDLVVTADTFNTNAWNLDFSVGGLFDVGRLQSLVFNGVPGNTVFDRTNPNKGTPGSDQGKDLAGFDSYCEGWFIVCYDQGDIRATYFNQVILGTDPFAGDIYAGLRIDFLSDGGLNEGSNWRFSLDTDIATTRLVETSNQALEAVPEPGSMVLLGTGLFALAAAARRRARRS